MKVKTLHPFSGVPTGTIGTAEKEEDGTYKITWDLPGRTKPIEDWFDPEEFKRHLVEI